MTVKIDSAASDPDNNGTDTPISEVSSSSVSLASTHSSQNSLVTITKRTQLDFSAVEEILSDVSSANSDGSPLWYILTTAVLLSYHKEKLIGDLWTYLAHQVHDDAGRLSVARILRESCLKSSTLVGFPRAINALFALKSAIEGSTPHLAPILAADTSLRSPLSSTEKYNRGFAFFNAIYRQHTSRVISAMDATSGQDLTHFAINCIYGELLSEHSIIGGLDTGLLEFVCCLADGCSPQAKGHFFGSINLGATNQTLRSTILLTENVALQLKVPCPWLDDPEEYSFLQRALGKP